MMMSAMVPLLVVGSSLLHHCSPSFLDRDTTVYIPTHGSTSGRCKHFEKLRDKYKRYFVKMKKPVGCPNCPRERGCGVRYSRQCDLYLSMDDESLKKHTHIVCLDLGIVTLKSKSKIEVFQQGNYGRSLIMTLLYNQRPDLKCVEVDDGSVRVAFFSGDFCDIDGQVQITMVPIHGETYIDLRPWKNHCQSSWYTGNIGHVVSKFDYPGKDYTLPHFCKVRLGPDTTSPLATEIKFCIRFLESSFDKLGASLRMENILTKSSGRTRSREEILFNSSYNPRSWCFSERVATFVQIGIDFKASNPVEDRYKHHFILEYKFEHSLHSTQ